MSASKLKKRSWGRSKPKDACVTVVDQATIEQTLQTLAERAKKPPAVAREESTATFELKYPELMSNDELVAALKLVKVPIPVYADGRPSRERLLHLYKTNVMPRPQRNGWRSRKRRVPAETTGSPQAGEGVMEVGEEEGGWSLNGSGSSGVAIKRKRKLSSSENVDGVTPCKKISADISQISLSDRPAAVATSTCTLTTTPPATVATPTTATAVTPPTLPAPITAPSQNPTRENSVHRMVKLKRPAISTVTTTSSTVAVSHISPPAANKPKAKLLPTKITEPTASGSGATPPKKVCRAKITWP